jgi:VWFA-related protein
LFSEDVEPRRAAIILFSDGEDTVSFRGMPDALEAAQRNGIAIYTITSHKPNLPRTGDSMLHYLATSTGGRDFIVKDQAGLKNALQSIHDELRNSYLLYYHPSEGGPKSSFRRVLVLPAQNSNLHLRTRAGYYAEP